MDKKIIELIKFPSAQSKSGTLTMFEKGKSPKSLVPFGIKRVFIITGLDSGAERGGHTHYKTNQILVCVSGGCTVNLDDGKEKSSVALDSPEQGLVLRPYVWHSMDKFKGGTILLVLADSEYDEKDYIRDYSQFLTLVKNK